MKISERYFNSRNVIRILFYIIGLSIVGLGVVITIVANIGVGPWDAFAIALFKQFGLSVGTWMNIVAVLALVVSSFLQKTYPKIICLMSSIVLGVFVDFWMAIFGDFRSALFIVNWGLFLLAIIVLAIGVSIYLVSGFPALPIDYFMLSIQKRFKLAVQFSKIICDTVGVTLALIAGGPVGIGTVILIFLFGPCIQFFLKYSTQIYEYLTLPLPIEDTNISQ